MTAKLSAEHAARIAAFPWPEGFPRDLEEAIAFLERNTPPEAMFTLAEPALDGALEAAEKALRGPIPPPLRTFLARHDGLTCTWAGTHPFVAAAAALPSLAEELAAQVQAALAHLIEEDEEEGSEGWREEILDELPESARSRIDLARLFPFGRNAAGDTWCLLPGTRSQTGEVPVLLWSHHGELKPRHTSFRNFLWYQTCYGHTHPHKPDPRLSHLAEPELRLSFVVEDGEGRGRRRGSTPARGSAAPAGRRRRQAVVEED